MSQKPHIRRDRVFMGQLLQPGTFGTFADEKQDDFFVHLTQQLQSPEQVFNSLLPRESPDEGHQACISGDMMLLKECFAGGFGVASFGDGNSVADHTQHRCGNALLLIKVDDTL